MSYFKLPKTLIKDLHRLIADFWWGFKAGKTKMHWEKWNEMCNSKERGVLKAYYFPSRDFLNARKGSKASFVWRSIIWGREVIERGSRWRIGSCANIDVIQDRWVPNPPMFKFFDLPPLPEGFKVFDLRLHNEE
ncbi:hypothetical protein UlMin_009221 [Ulmus minor]